MRCRAGSSRRWGTGVRGPGSGGRGWRSLGCALCLRWRGGGAAVSGPTMQGFGRALRQRVSGAEEAGQVGVCLPDANNVISRTHLKKGACTLSRSLALSLPPPLSLSLSLSLSPRSLARSLGVCVHARMRRCVNEAFRNGDTSADISQSQCHKARTFRDGVASVDVSLHRGRRLQDNPP